MFMVGIKINFDVWMGVNSLSVKGRHVRSNRFSILHAYTVLTLRKLPIQIFVL